MASKNCPYTFIDLCEETEMEESADVIPEQMTDQIPEILEVNDNFINTHNHSSKLIINNNKP